MNPLNWSGKIADFMLKLASDGGASTTRWVFARTAEVVSFGWLCLVAAQVYRVWRFGTTDAGLLTLIGTLAAALFSFATYTQTTKMSIDSKSSGSSAKAETIGANVTTGDPK